jgi:hypothetical protein
MIDILYWIHNNIPNNIFKFGNGDLISYIEKSGVGLIANVCLLLIPLISILVYYIVIDHPRLNNKIIWISTVLVVAVITAFVLDGILYDYVNSYAETNGIDLSEHLIYFTNIWFVNFLISLILTIAFSFLLKIKSNNNSKTPF